MSYLDSQKDVKKEELSKMESHVHIPQKAEMHTESFTTMKHGMHVCEMQNHVISIHAKSEIYEQSSTEAKNIMLSKNEIENDIKDVHPNAEMLEQASTVVKFEVCSQIENHLEDIPPKAEMHEESSAMLKFEVCSEIENHVEDIPPKVEMHEETSTMVKFEVCSEMESQEEDIHKECDVHEESCSVVFEQNVGSASAMETQIQNISMEEMTNLMAQGGPVSFVILSEGEDALEWIGNSVILNSQNATGHEEGERMIILESTGKEQTIMNSSEAVGTHERLSRKRNHSYSGSPDRQPLLNSKVMKCSNEKASRDDGVEMKGENPPCTVSETKEVGNIHSGETETSLHTVKDFSSETLSLQKFHKTGIIKQEEKLLKDCQSVSTGSSLGLSPPLSEAGSISKISVSDSVCAFSAGNLSSNQEISMAITTTTADISDSVCKPQLLTSSNGTPDCHSIQSSSQGASVELAAIGDTGENMQGENRIVESSPDSKGSRENVNYGIAEGGVVYRCAECDYASSNKHYYKQHVDLVHNTARPFKCPFCDYAGKRGHALREHLVVHSAQRPYSCMYCNATFRKKGHLTNHTKLHAASSAMVVTSSSSEAPEGRGQVTAVTSGKLVKIPVSTDAVHSNTIITVTAEPSGTSAAIVPPSQKNKEINPCFSKKNQLWCALCDKEMADAGLFQAHLKSVHGTDRLFACDSCEYVTANKGAILSHLALHVPTSKAEGSPHPTPASITALPPGATPLYTCTHCGFSTPKMSVLVSHAASHITAGAGSSAPVSNKTAMEPSSQQQKTSKLLCSECGHVADNTDQMYAHLWTHIDNNVAEPKGERVPLQSHQQKSTNDAASLSITEENLISNAVATGLKTLPHNAAFKCTECSYVSRDASQFVKHMLVHKTQHNQAPKQQQIQNTSLDPEKASGNAAAPNSRSGLPYKVKPIATENTCQNAESSPFVHDTSTGRFRCIICGYTCEYQRTIKAHIWKHSGHHQVDYPIFQNGPLSMYEDPLPASQSSSSHGSTTNSSQPSSGIISVRVDSSPASLPGTEANHVNKPAHSTPERTPSCTNPSSSAVSAPLSVKFITVSGSQVLHSSGPLPPGNLKLIPFQTAPATKPVSSESANKHVVVRVQGPHSQSLGPPCSPTVSGKASGISESVCEEKMDAATFKVLDVVLNKNQVLQNRTASSEEVPGSIESKPPSNICVQVQVSHKPDQETDLKLVKADAADDEVERPSTIVKDCSVPAVSNDRDFTPLTSPKATPSVKLAESAVSEKHELPIVADNDDMQQKQVSIQTRPHNNISGPVSFLSDQKNETSTSITPLCDSNNTSSLPPQSGFSKLPTSLKDGTPDVTMSKNTANIASTDEDKLKPIKDGLILKQKQTENNELHTEFLSEESVVFNVQSSRESTMSSSEQNVVVEPVNTLSTHCNLTGLRIQQRSPHGSRSLNSSPVLVDVSESQPFTHTQDQQKRGEIRLVSNSLEVPAKEELLVSASNEISDVPQMECKTTEPGDCVKSQVKAQTVQDSESAVTLLSLLKRGPNFNPVCHSSSSHSLHAEGQEPGPNSPNRSSTSSSEIAAESTDNVTDTLSEDLSSDVKSKPSGKSRAAGGGICSTLLAVIEQLRERSRSESDVEDKNTHPPAKKRMCRRRGRQDSQEEILDVDNSGNIEQLSGEDGVNYRCKLCHYTNHRVPLIRLHMRTHRRKDPFECSLCPMVAESSEMLQDHMIKHCKVRTYACKFCPQSFNHKSTLRAHLRAHNDSDPFLCDLCDFECSNPLDYRAHMQKHTGGNLLGCPRCPALVASQQDLRLHLAGNCQSTLSSPKEKMDAGSCEETVNCEKIANPQKDSSETEKCPTEDHISNRSGTSMVGIGLAGEGPLRCALCDFTAVSSRSLKSHMKRHANDQRYVQQPLEQYKCSLCGYVCHHLPSLKSHMWRHASNQNYSYQFTNDVINAAIDYDSRSDPVPQPSRSAGVVSMEVDEPELLDRVLSTERRIVEGQMNRHGGSEPVCWVTFRCCQCGFETINKAKLNLHMRTHADIINRTLKVNSGLASESETVPTSVDTTDSDMNVKIVYGPV